MFFKSIRFFISPNIVVIYIKDHPFYIKTMQNLI